MAKAIRDDDALFDAVIAASPHRLREVLDHHPNATTARAALEGYFATYGHQVFTLDFAEPCEAENPSTTLQSLYDLLLTPYDADVVRQRLSQRRRESFRAANKHFKGVLTWRFWWRVWIARRYYPNRERAMSYLGPGMDRPAPACQGTGSTAGRRRHVARTR